MANLFMCGGGVRYGTISVSATSHVQSIDLTSIDGYENIVYIGVVKAYGTWTSDSAGGGNANLVNVAHTKGSATATITIAPNGRIASMNWNGTLLYVIDASA